MHFLNKVWTVIDGFYAIRRHTNSKVSTISVRSVNCSLMKLACVQGQARLRPKSPVQHGERRDLFDFILLHSSCVVLVNWKEAVEVDISF